MTRSSLQVHQMRIILFENNHNFIRVVFYTLYRWTRSTSRSWHVPVMGIVRIILIVSLLRTRITKRPRNKMEDDQIIYFGDFEGGGMLLSVFLVVLVRPSPLQGISVSRVHQNARLHIIKDRFTLVMNRILIVYKNIMMYRHIVPLYHYSFTILTGWYTPPKKLWLVQILAAMLKIQKTKNKKT